MLGVVGATYPQHCGASLTPSLLPRASNFLRTSVSLKATRVPKILPRDLHFESGVSQTPQQGIEVLASSSFPGARGCSEPGKVGGPASTWRREPWRGLPGALSPAVCPFLDVGAHTESFLRPSLPMLRV